MKKYVCTKALTKQEGPNVSWDAPEYSVSHNFIYPYIFAGNQGNHQNFVPSLVPIDF